MIVTSFFVEFLVCSQNSLPGCDEGCLTLLGTGFFGGLERRSALKMRSRGLFGDYPCGLDIIFAVLISSAGDELPRLGKWS